MKQLIVFKLLCFCCLCTHTFAQQGNRPGKGGQFGPSERTLKGKVINGDTGEGLEFATISVFSKRDSSIIGGGLTETDGRFSFKVKGFKMYAEVEFIGYEALLIDPISMKKGVPFLDLGELVLNSSSVQLADVEITAEKSETTFSLDKRIFNVGKDLANRGGNAEDVLDNVPSVNVDIDGNVSLRGSEGVRLLIDGKPSSLVGVSNSNGLKNIPSNLIEQVEVITNPSARYEAEGMAGIINIILKKNQGHGFNGSVDVSGGSPTRGGISANLNYRKGALNWFVNYGVNYRSGPGGGYSIQDRNLSSNGLLSRNLTTLDRNINRGGLSNSLRLGADLFISDKEQLTGALSYRVGDDDNNSDLLYHDYSEEYGDLGLEPLWQDPKRTAFFDFDSFEELLSTSAFYGETIRTDDELEDESNLEYNLNYSREFSSRKHKLNASVQYRDKKETEANIFKESFKSLVGGNNFDLEQTANNSEIERTWLFQVDYIKPLGKDHKWEIGARSSLRKIDTDFLVQEKVGEVFQTLDGLENDFLYNEDIHAIYGIYGNRHGNISYQAGLRGEYSTINTQLLDDGSTTENPREYFNLFPSGHLSFHLSETDALQLSYSRRVRRPRFWDLNPFFTFQDRRNYFAGNPNVNPEFTDSYEFGQIKYWNALSLNTSIFYRKTTGTIQRAISIDNLEIFTLRVPVNIGSTDDYGLDLSLSYTGKKWIRISFNTNIFRNQLSLNADEANSAIYEFYRTVRGFDEDISAFNERFSFQVNETDNITWNSKLTTRFTIYKSDLQIRMNYRGPRENAQGNSRGIGSLDLGWSKDFLANKNLTLTLSIRDLLNSRRRAGILIIDEFFQQSEFQWRSRSANLTVSYRINQKKKKYGRGSGSQNDGGNSDY